MARTQHFSFAVRLLFLMVNCQLPSLAISSTNLTTDQFALLALRAHITFDPRRIIMNNWTNQSSVCFWIGVTCGSHHARVTTLDISHMGVKGTLPPHLGNLSFLTFFNIAYNLFSGILPQELSYLRRLKAFSVEGNKFSGGIPTWLGLLPQLNYLSLGNNSFVGVIPNSISNLSTLAMLNFSYNSLGGSIPEELGNLRSLRSLYLQYNHLSGSIPTTIFNLSALETASFTSNQLHGNLPLNLCRNLTSLKRIGLSLNQLTGQIPSTISECSKLQILSLSYNSFSGHVPKEIGKLKYLELLYLGGNNLNGAIPQEIGNIQNLVEFAIESNQITGQVPVYLYNISSLQRLYLRDNKLVGILPRDVGNLTLLKYLSVTRNNLTGDLPREIAKLSQLEELSVDYNSFTCSISRELFNMSSLRVLSLSTTNLVGSLPISLCDGLPLIEEIYLDENDLNGVIPYSISNCSKLSILSLTDNKLTGYVPYTLGNLKLLKVLSLALNNLRIESSLSFITSLANCRLLTSLSISYNPLDMFIPNSVGNLSTSLQNFLASTCQIKGRVPFEIGNLSNLVKVRLHDNELIGSIPPTIKNLDNLQGLSLDKNNMRGSIPESICSLHNLVELVLSQNQFSGPIPYCIGNVTSLRLVDLNSNLLTSSVPSSLSLLKDLLTLDLSSNSLSGNLPLEISALVSAVKIRLSTNNISGHIPDTIGKLIALGELSLGNNALQGFIPVSMGSMINLKILDLSHNNLSGSIPMTLQALQYLNQFNVSFNALIGEIPTEGPFKNFTMESFIANRALCGIAKFHVPPCHVTKARSRGRRVRVVLLSILGVIACILVVALPIFLVKRYKRKEKVTSTVNATMSMAPGRISYYELSQATEKFSESNLLGKGSFSSVYKGTFRDGKVLAIKVFNLELEAAFRSFDVECEVLRSIRHRNLTKVISSCSNEEFKALALEYMPNGSLENWLHPTDICLDVLQRLNIMLDVASALEYLHHGNPMPIVHCDLKPSNILLDEDMIAHVSDFGIAKLLGTEESITRTNTLATFGYIAPEYGTEGLVSTRCDVYSFGVILMEVFTRKRPSDEMFAGDLSLKIWIEGLLYESPEQVIDANLLNSMKEISVNYYDTSLQCISCLLELALKCSEETPKDRMDIKEVVVELQKIKRRILA